MGNIINKQCSAFLLVGSLLFQGCIAYGNKDKISLTSEVKKKTTLNVSLSSLDVSNNIVTIHGSGFSGVTALKIKGNGVDTTLNINSQSDTQIRAVATTNALAFLVGATFDLILSSASAQTTYPITFTLDSMNAQSGQVLKFNGTSWGPENLASSQTYLGTWNASTQTPALEASPNTGDYYIVTVAGDYPNAGNTYNIGDWIIYNGTSWEKVVSGLSTKLSLTGGTLTGDLGLDTLLKFKGASNYVTLKASASLASDITLTLPITVGTNGQVLTTNGSGVLSWSTPATVAAPSGTAGGDLSGTYPNPTITALSAAKIADGSVNNTKFQYLSGVTSDIQTQLDAKQSGGNFITALTGDVTAAGPGSVAATVAQVGGVTAANIAAGVNIANAATNANTNSAAVKRDASGNFSAGTITATLNGTATNVTGTVAVANGGTGNTSLTLNELLFGNGTGAIGSVTSTGTPSVLLSTNITGAPAWTTSTTGNFLKATTGVGVSFGAIGASDLPAGTLSGAGTVGYIPYYSTTTGLADSPLVVNGSKVGIGMISPVSVLSVKNPATSGKVFSIFGNDGLELGYFGTDTGFVNTSFRWANNGAGTYNFSVDGSGNTLMASLNTSNIKGGSGATSTLTLKPTSGSGTTGADVIFQVGNNGATEAMRILNNGRVGIGTATPSGILDVQGGSAPASTAGTGINITAQNATGPSGGTGGTITLTGGTGVGGWPGGSVRVVAVNGQYAGLSVDNGMTTNYVSSSAAVNRPARGIQVSNNFSLDNNGSLINSAVNNSSGRPQSAYFGPISVAGAANYSPVFVIGQSTGATSYSENLRIDGATGYVGIGNVNPTEKLHVTGNILASGTVVGSSDRRLKKKIRPIEDALKKLDQITGVKYFWIEPELHNEGEQIGVIAQEVEKVFPQAVVTGSDGIKAVSYMGLVAPVIQAIKELNAKFQGMLAKLTGVETRVQNLEKENAELKARLLKIEKALNTKSDSPDAQKASGESN